MKRIPLTRAGGLVAAGAALVVLAAGLTWLLAADEPAVDAAPGTAALRVAIDPETGELGPAPAGDKSLELQQMLRRDDEGLVEVHHPDGSASIDLQGRFMSASVARINDDGELETICTTDSDQARDFLAGQDAQPEVK